MSWRQTFASGPPKPVIGNSRPCREPTKVAGYKLAPHIVFDERTTASRDFLQSHKKSEVCFQEPLRFRSATAAALSERGRAPHCRCCRVWRSLSMTRYLPALDRRRHHRQRGGRIIIIDRSDRPTSIVAPNRNLRTTIR
jgi:hypothetical protein